MKKLLLLVLGAVAVNQLLESTRHCMCDDDCWCKTPVGRYFRWVIPYGHKVNGERLGYVGPGN
ncbi:MAG: hypothetical protein ABR579_04550 [Actinomycetota bacterium]